LQSVLGADVITGSIEIQQTMMDVYETIYNVFNHLKNFKSPPASRRPLASVAFHKGEDFTTGSLLEDTMRIFRDLPIKDIFGIDYLQFMKLPVDIVEMMVKMAREKHENESKTAAKADHALKSSLREEQQRHADALKGRKMIR